VALLSRTQPAVVGRAPGLLARALLAAACCLAFAPVASSADQASREYLLKAAFLFNFTQFVEWPAESFADDAAPIRIGVLGADPFGQALEETVRDEVVRARRLVIERAQSAEELRDCHLVFVGGHAAATAIDLSVLDRAPILVVCEDPVTAEQGAVVRFYLDGQKVRFEINPAEASRRGLKMSAQLLSLARIVGPADGALP
jgi:hypothetical protein